MALRMMLSSPEDMRRLWELGGDGGFSRIAPIN